MTNAQHAADVGDLIVIAGHHVGESERIAEILEVLGERPNERYRVRWDDDRESVYFPGSRRDDQARDAPTIAKCRAMTDRNAP